MNRQHMWVRGYMQESIDDFLCSLEDDASEGMPHGANVRVVDRVRTRIQHAFQNTLSMDAEYVPAIGLASTIVRYQIGKRLAVADHPFIWIPYQSASMGALAYLCGYLQQLL